MYRVLIIFLVTSILTVIFLSLIGLSQISDCIDKHPVKNIPCFFNEHIEYVSVNQSKAYIDILTLYLPFKSIHNSVNGPTKVVLGYPILGGILSIPITFNAGDNPKTKYGYVLCRTKNNLQSSIECSSMNNQSILPFIKKGQLVGISSLSILSLQLRNKSKCNEKTDKFFDMIISKEKLAKLLFNIPNDKCGLSVNIVYF